MTKQKQLNTNSDLLPELSNYNPPLADGVRVGESPVPGLTLRRILRGHKKVIGRIAWSPDGCFLAAPSNDKTVCIWNVANGESASILEEHEGEITSVSWSPDGQKLALSSANSRIDDETIGNAVRIWDAESRELLTTIFKGRIGQAWRTAWSPDGRLLVSMSSDGSVYLWDGDDYSLVQIIPCKIHGYATNITWSPSGREIALSIGNSIQIVKVSKKAMTFGSILQGHTDWVFSVSWSQDSRLIASSSRDETIRLWDSRTGKESQVLEGHTGSVTCLSFSADGRTLASKAMAKTGRSGEVYIWDTNTWAIIARLQESVSEFWPPGIAFHPHLHCLATLGEESTVIRIWEMDCDLLLSQVSAPAVHRTTGKIVLVGDHSVGKSALGYRMIHGAFKEQASTHGQRFWVFPELGKRRADGTECEAILWDFAGQPDYRLVHALFLDDADLALVVFDSSDIHDPLHGVGFWIKQLQSKKNQCPIILVAAQIDRGSCPLTHKELTAYCRQHGITGPIHTSALTGEGVQDLIEQMKAIIPWEEKPATVTTTKFKRIKDYLLNLKQNSKSRSMLKSLPGLYNWLGQTDKELSQILTQEEMVTVLGHLENHGYVKKLCTSKGEERVLLAPELLNNLASSFVLEARRNPKGLGSLEERRLLSGGYGFAELAGLTNDERDVLLDATSLLFLEHNVCFRETDPLSMKSYLVFPELINLKKPIGQDRAAEDGVAYTVSGPTENVFASLVVLLGYTQTFTRTKQWQNNARYEVGAELVCGFRQEGERDGELDFVLCFYPEVGQPVRTLFQGLFESFLARRNLTVMRYEPVHCTKKGCGQMLDRSVVRQRMKEGKDFACCNECGQKLKLPKMAEPIQLTRKVHVEVETQRRMAEQRTRFEQAVFCVQTYVTEQDIKPPECFISYAWGDAKHERWVERQLATDLQKAGIDVVLDRWENAKIGASVSRFVQRLGKVSHVVVVGTPFYLEKYENKDPERGYVVSAEFDIIANRMLGTEAQKESVLPVLLEGEKATSLPVLLHDRVYADFRKGEDYFLASFDLILSLYEIAPNNPAVADLRESLRGPEL